MPETTPIPVLRWRCDIARPAPRALQIYRGETARLECLLTLQGDPATIPSGATATLAWQSRDMGASWYTAPATVDAERGAVLADFTPAMDSGAEEFRAFLRVDGGEGSGICYRASALLQMLDSPGATINEIPIPPRVLDFATIEVLNAPYYTQDEADERFAAAADIPDPSSGDPQMDGAASAGSSAAYARGDHRHPTDTSRASVADATLNGRGFGEWMLTISPETDLFDPLGLSWTPPSDAYPNGGWNPRGGGVLKGDASSTELTWGVGEWLGGLNGYVITATRTALPGYVLGGDEPGDPNHEKYLAGIDDVPVVVAPSTSDADAGKAADAKATGDALAGKLGKDGGIISGSVIVQGNVTADSIQIARVGTPVLETWTFEVDNGQGGTTTIEKGIFVAQEE